jgi:hypothetical protein
VNERWPNYWASLFARDNYLAIDCIRGKIWTDDDVKVWYAQNTFLYASEARIRDDPVLRREHARTNTQQMCIVHPKKYLEIAKPRELTVGDSCQLFVDSLKRAIHNFANKHIVIGKGQVEK